MVNLIPLINRNFNANLNYEKIRNCDCGNLRVMYVSRTNNS